jgi:hypothetical protein
METLYDKLVRLERLANPEAIPEFLGPRRRESYNNRITAAPATPSNHIIPLRQELYRLRAGLNEALSIIKELNYEQSLSNSHRDLS